MKKNVKPRERVFSVRFGHSDEKISTGRNRVEALKKAFRKYYAFGSEMYSEFPYVEYIPLADSYIRIKVTEDSGSILFVQEWLVKEI